MQITFNHGHTLVIPAADLDTLVPLTYSIGGLADHSHDVTFTPAQMAQMRAGQTVTVATTFTIAHNHDVSSTCS